MVVNANYFNDKAWDQYFKVLFRGPYTGCPETSGTGEV